MNDKNLSVAEFAGLVGTTSKTIYERLKRNSELPVIERLLTVEQKVKGRSITLISTNSEQIQLYKNIYKNFDKKTVNEGKNINMLTNVNESEQLMNENNEVKNDETGSKQPDIIARLLTINEDNNNRILQLTDELIISKQSQLLLEDKAGREGLYLKEINDLKTRLETDNHRNRIIIYSLITVLILLLFVIVTSLTWYFTVNIK